MSTKIKLALAAALVLSTTSAVLAAPRHSTNAPAISKSEQLWLDRASQADTNGF